MFDAVVTAGGRLQPGEAVRFGTDVKALIAIGGTTLLEKIVAALRALPAVQRVCVVGPAAARTTTAADVWINEYPSGEENIMAALQAGRTEKVIYCTSDLPFVSAGAIADFIARVRGDIDGAYPIFTRAEFTRAFPGGRASFVRLADGEWTGGNVMLVDPQKLLADPQLIRRGFRARKNPLALAAIFGPALALKYLAGRARVDDLVVRGGRLIGGKVAAVRGADPVLAMDCDNAEDIEYARSREDARSPA